MVKLSADNAIQFYEDKSGDSTLPFLMEHLVSGPILCLELMANNAVQKLIEIAGNIYFNFYNRAQNVKNSDIYILYFVYFVYG